MTGYEGIYEWRPGAWLKLSGGDAAGFLQGQFSQDLRSAGEREAVYGLWLDHKGKIQGDGFVIKGAGEFWILSYALSGKELKQRLENFIVADDVEVEDLSQEAAGVTVVGGEKPAAPEGLWVFPGRRMDGPHWECVGPAGAVQSALQGALRGLPALARQAMERRRILAGIPAVPEDAGPGDLPQEAGLGAAAVSYDKGCYVGQEVMARLKTRGRLRRRLMLARGAGKPPEGRCALWAGERRVGELRSRVGEEGGGFVGLAMIGSEAAGGSRAGLAAGAADEIELTEILGRG